MKTVYQSRFKIICGCLLCLLMIFTVIITCSVNGHKVFAETQEQEEITANAIGNNDNIANPYGLYTHLSLSINGGNGKVWATVRNDFTLFPSTVRVIVELYSSETYKENYTDMELVIMNSIEDLDQGNSIVAEGYTYGVQKYWQARMRYRIDNGSWESKDTGTLLYSANGDYLGLT